MSDRRWKLTDREREGRQIETIERLANEKETLVRERDLAEAALTRGSTELIEARAAARELLDLLQSSAADHDHDEGLFERWPWLKEKPGGDEPPGQGE
jgi:hypothetical protein